MKKLEILVTEILEAVMQGFGHTIVQMCNIKNTNIVNELKVKTKEMDKKNS